jgi:hypothetical protein
LFFISLVAAFAALYELVNGRPSALCWLVFTVAMGIGCILEALGAHTNAVVGAIERAAAAD